MFLTLLISTLVDFTSTLMELVECADGLIQDAENLIKDFQFIMKSNDLILAKCWVLSARDYRQGVEKKSGQALAVQAKLYYEHAQEALDKVKEAVGLSDLQPQRNFGSWKCVFRRYCIKKASMIIRSHPDCHTFARYFSSRTSVLSLDP
ncbi:hypothetical protein BJV77DRAFT_243216 [Russula vinacea]|nr:hypothetical protein BJV77DRAFT_243216 [Russula vinacea]